MKKASKLALVALLIIVAVTIPTYIYVRQNAGTEGSIQIMGAVGNSENFTYTQLKAFTPVTVTVTLTSSSHVADNGVFNYTGVSLAVLLAQVQVSANATSVYVQAADGYGTTTPIEDAQKANTILAYERNGTTLMALSAGGEGPFRLIIGDDQFAQRWVRGVSVIEVS